MLVCVFEPSSLLETIHVKIYENDQPIDPDEKLYPEKKVRKNNIHFNTKVSKNSIYFRLESQKKSENDKIF